MTESDIVCDYFDITLEYYNFNCWNDPSCKSTLVTNAKKEEG